MSSVAGAGVEDKLVRGLLDGMLMGMFTDDEGGGDSCVLGASVVLPDALPNVAQGLTPSPSSFPSSVPPSPRSCAMLAKCVDGHCCDEDKGAELFEAAAICELGGSCGSLVGLPTGLTVQGGAEAGGGGGAGAAGIGEGVAMSGRSTLATPTGLVIRSTSSSRAEMRELKYSMSESAG